MPVRSSPAGADAAAAMPARSIETAAENIFKAFNTWRFKREQPSDRSGFVSVLQRAVVRSEPVEFVLYWGKGPRNHVAEPDRTCLAFLDALAASVRAVHTSGVRMTLIYTDTHAGLNGHDHDAIETYGDELRAAAAEKQFDVRLLSDLVSGSRAARALTEAHNPPADLIKLLDTSAARWYGGDLPSSMAARRYYDQNMRERLAVQEFFPHAIFVTFNNSRHRGLFPENMPIFYMYSLRKGTATKPWFLDDAGRPAQFLGSIANDPARIAAE